MRACLGGDSFLFNEQFVVKGAGTGASFAWHQDGAYVGFDHRPYLTVWIALDDTTEENGCVYLLPRDLDAQPGLDPHEWQEASRELNGYSGDDPGRPMTCRAGTVVAFSSLTLHRSGDNRTDTPRRAYVCQYSGGTAARPRDWGIEALCKAGRGLTPVRRLRVRVGRPTVPPMPRSLFAMLCLIALGGCVDREAVDAVLGPEGEVGETPAFLPLGTLEALETSLPENPTRTRRGLAGAGRDPSGRTGTDLARERRRTAGAGRGTARPRRGDHPVTRRWTRPGACAKALPQANVF